MKNFLHKNFTLIAFCLLLFSILLMPQTTLSGASRGLLLWWEKVVPALLPFFIIADILINLGGFTYITKALAPFCQKLFRMSGETGAAVVLGFTSGFPTGAAVCSSLLDNSAISKQDAARLICFTNNSSPLFITVTVCTAVLQAPQAGIYMILIHYGISLIYGIISARFAPVQVFPHKTSSLPNEQPKQKPLGALLKNASQKAIMQISLIGCYLIFFSLLCAVLQELKIFNILGTLFTPLWKILGFDAILGESFFYGITEMTLGIAQTAQSSADFAQRFALCAFFLSFGGLSVQAQVYAMIATHELNFKPFLASCLIKGVAAYLIALPIGKYISLSVSHFPVAPLANVFLQILPLLGLLLLAIFYAAGKFKKI